MYWDILFLAINLSIFYLYLLPSIGNSVAIKCRSSWICKRYLSEQIIAGWKYDIDLADKQWSMIRSSLLIIVFVICTNKVITDLWNVVTKTLKLKQNIELLGSQLIRLCISSMLLVFLHGIKSFQLLCFAIIGYLLITNTKTNPKIQTYLCWIYAIALLLLKESSKFKFMSPYTQIIFVKSKYDGIYSWYFPLNFFVLRYISYVIDCNSNQYLNKASNLIDYLVYMFYAPLYIAGPIITYEAFHNDIRAQIYTRDTLDMDMKWKSVLKYIFRWLVSFIILEFMLNQYPTFAIVSSGLFFKTLTLAEMIVTCYLLLLSMWLKFLLLWRLCRLWALLDEINPPENMLTCVSNNYSLEKFWKGWHTSFNKWLIQYMYVPMGGSDYRLWNVWVIFVFVALWHDFEWKLIVWGLMNALFYCIEVATKRFYKTSIAFKLSKVQQIILSTLSGALYILVLVATNLIGYGVGIGGIEALIMKANTIEGYIVLGTTIYFLCIGVSIMRQIKQQ